MPFRVLFSLLALLSFAPWTLGCQLIVDFDEEPGAGGAAGVGGTGGSGGSGGFAGIPKGEQDTVSEDLAPADPSNDD